MDIWDDARVDSRLPCQDLERARAWYRDKLGLEATEEREGGLRYALGGTEFCLYTSQGSSPGTFTQVALYVKDVDRAVAVLRERGVEFYSDVVDIEGNYPSKGTGERATWFTDCEGNMLGIAHVV